MAVCNANLSFTNFVCKWHGSVHDSAAFNSSNLQMHMESGGGRNGWLLGDRGYGIQPYLTMYLMTVFNDPIPTTAPQRKYQKAHTKTRNMIERAFGLWKTRFRCLDSSDGPLQFTPSHCCTIITATAVLHNMCIFDKTPLPDNADDPPQQLDVVPDPRELIPDSNAAGTSVRDRLINDVFC